MLTRNQIAEYELMAGRLINSLFVLVLVVICKRKGAMV